MANLKEIRTRISSVKSTRQITSAMKMVSAAKLRKAQNTVMQVRPYSQKLEQIMQQLVNSLEDSNKNIYAKERKIKKVLIVLIGSNKGLCGAFNQNIIKKLNAHINDNFNFLENDKIELMIFGKKLNEYLANKNHNIIATYYDLIDTPNYNEVSVVANELMEFFTNGAYDRIDFIFNKFKNASNQDLLNIQFLPVNETKTEDNFTSDYIFEPNEEEIINRIVPNALTLELYKSILESIASEHGARMTSMHKATDNATELIKELNLTYNKARQSSITNEIIEIVSGAQALNG